MSSHIQRYRAFFYSFAAVLLSAFIRLVLIIVGLYALTDFYDMNVPIPNRIESMFSMTLPETARNFGWHHYSGDGYFTLVRFTVDLEDLETTLRSVNWNTEQRCIREPREDGFMPIFSWHDDLLWWRPRDAKIFDGVMCEHYNPHGLAPNYGILVDYGIRDGEATVYIEEYSIDADGYRAGWNYD